MEKWQSFSTFRNAVVVVGGEEVLGKEMGVPMDLMDLMDPVGLLGQDPLNGGGVTRRVPMLTQLG
jgi:hypothetical protein